jgi:hypothetical protein
MWLIPSSKTPSKQQLLSASAIALKLAWVPLTDPFIQLHR